MLQSSLEPQWPKLAASWARGGAMFSSFRFYPYQRPKPNASWATFSFRGTEACLEGYGYPWVLYLKLKKWRLYERPILQTVDSREGRRLCRRTEYPINREE